MTEWLIVGPAGPEWITAAGTTTACELYERMHGLERFSTVVYATNWRAK